MQALGWAKGFVPEGQADSSQARSAWVARRELLSRRGSALCPRLRRHALTLPGRLPEPEACPREIDSEEMEC